MRIPLAVLSLGIAWPASAQAPCLKSPAATSLYLEAAAPAPSDTVMTVRLCLASPKRLGSYMALLRFDSTLTRASHVTTRGGDQAVNATTPGEVRIAGAAPSGFANGELATIKVTRRQRSPVRIALAVSEANTTSGTSVLRELAVVGWQERSAAVATPVIDSISPRAGTLDGDRVSDVTIYGRGFAAHGNLILFGKAEIPGLMSEAHGTVIRFSAPALRTADGNLSVRVKHGGRRSNAVTFTVKDGKR
jgi:hypothetical protein